MIHLKYFNESNSEVTIREKLESIVDFYEYLCSLNMMDSFSFVGKCATLFLTSLKVVRNWTNKPYEFDIDSFMENMEKNEKRRIGWKEEKLKQIDELYEISKIKRFSKTKEDIINFLKPALECEVVGYKVLSSYTIEQYYNGWLKKCCFSIKVKIDEEFLTMDEKDVKDLSLSKERSFFKEVESEFYSYKNLIKNKISDLNPKLIGFDFKLDDSSHLLDFYHFTIRLEEI